MFITRDNTDNKINGAFPNPQSFFTEEIANDSPELIEFLNPVKNTKSPELIQAENAYIYFCKSLGFGSKASTEEIQTLAEQQDDKVKALEIAVKALGLINEITQLGGNWNNIGE